MSMDYLAQHYRFSGSNSSFHGKVQVFVDVEWVDVCIEKTEQSNFDMAQSVQQLLCRSSEQLVQYPYYNVSDTAVYILDHDSTLSRRCGSCRSVHVFSNEGDWSYSVNDCINLRMNCLSL
jgi:hypothetical protein